MSWWDLVREVLNGRRKKWPVVATCEDACGICVEDTKWAADIHGLGIVDPN